MNWLPSLFMEKTNEKTYKRNRKMDIKRIYCMVYMR